jgi:endonuclease/exonuclease/phosphatase family metal-dependent hydrolase
MTSLRFAAYNIEWMTRLFRKKSTEPLTGSGSKEYKRSLSIAKVIKKIDPDILGICEAPNSQKHLENWLQEFLNGAGYSVAMHNEEFLSPGQQEIAVLFKGDKVHVKVKPEGEAKHKPFNKKIEMDTDDDRIKEVYKFYRPPLEVEIEDLSGKQLVKLLVAHTKSKGIFNQMDMLHYERTSRRDRMKLFAEASWIRYRTNQWLDEKSKVVVMGDFNDGPEMDYYETLFGKSAIELAMGSIWEPERILHNVIGKPKWGEYGWKPTSARFKDRFTEDYVNVLIDHILISDRIKISEPGLVWNPYQEKIEDEKVSEAFKGASDHFPISVGLELD